MAVGYGVAKTALPAIGTANPAGMSALEASIQECMDTLAAKVTATGVDFSAVAEAGHGARVIPFDASKGQASGATWTAPTGVAGGYFVSVGAADTVTVDIHLQVGETLSGAPIIVYGRSNGASFTAKFFKRALGTNVATQIGTTGTSGSGVGTDTNATISIGTPEVVVSTNSYYILWTSGAASARIYGGLVQCTR